MSALDELDTFLQMSPSCIEPWEVRAYLDAIRDENVKLRESVKQMHDHIKESCDICDEDYCSSWDKDNECCVYDTLIRKVGIEVDE